MCAVILLLLFQIQSYCYPEITSYIQDLMSTVNAHGQRVHAFPPLIYRIFSFMLHLHLLLLLHTLQKKNHLTQRGSVSIRHSFPSFYNSFCNNHPPNHQSQCKITHSSRHIYSTLLFTRVNNLIVSLNQLWWGISEFGVLMI